MHCGDQFSSGDQGDGKKSFWRSGFRTCQKCGQEEIKSVDHVAGCRMNGDGYGTTVFTCQACGWETSFQYDEAAETYYYETSGWDREERKFVIPPRDLDDEMVQKFRRIQKILKNDYQVRQAMIQEGISTKDIDTFFQQNPT